MVEELAKIKDKPLDTLFRISFVYSRINLIECEDKCFNVFSESNEIMIHESHIQDTKIWEDLYHRSLNHRPGKPPRITTDKFESMLPPWLWNICRDMMNSHGHDEYSFFHQTLIITDIDKVTNDKDKFYT